MNRIVSLLAVIAVISLPAQAQSTPPAPAEQPKPQPADDDSAMFGFTPGTTTRAEVEKKLGKASMENHMRPDAYSVVYTPRPNVMVACLFDKNDVLIRTRGYVKD